MPANRLLRASILCGIVAPLLWATAIAVCGALRPGFDHVSQLISELGERGSPTESLMRYFGFVVTGLLHIGFAPALYAAVATGGTAARTRVGAAAMAGLFVLNGLGRIGAGIYSCVPGCAAPLEPIQRLHGQAATLAFVAMIGAAFAGAILFRRRPRLAPLSRYSLATATAAIAFLALMLASESTRAGTGLYERLASGTLSLWVLLVAARLWVLARGRDQAAM